MILGIEIGGTKLQLGVGSGNDAELVELRRIDIVPEQGASGILNQIERCADDLSDKHTIDRVGIGFGGPVNVTTGQITKSHQIDGWDDFPIVQWFRDRLDCPVALGNDCDVAALAEAKYGAGQGESIVFYVTVGTGVGGGLVVDGRLHAADRPAAAEIGHLRPGIHAELPDATVESIASGWGIAAVARSWICQPASRRLETLSSGGMPHDPHSLGVRIASVDRLHQENVEDLHRRCDGDIEDLTAKMIAQAATEGNRLAGDVIGHACQTLGWAIAQAVTLTSPNVVVIGGGVPLMGEQLFFNPLRSEVARYVFPPLANSFQIVPAVLGETVVVHGAIALASSAQ